MKNEYAPTKRALYSAILLAALIPSLLLTPVFLIQGWELRQVAILALAQSWSSVMASIITMVAVTFARRCGPVALTLTAFLSQAVMIGQSDIFWGIDILRALIIAGAVYIVTTKPRFNSKVQTLSQDERLRPFWSVVLTSIAIIGLTGLAIYRSEAYLTSGWVGLAIPGIIAILIVIAWLSAQISFYVSRAMAKRAS